MFQNYIIFPPQQIEKIQVQEMQEVYLSKMKALEEKFKYISEKYSQVVQESLKKDKLILELSSTIKKLQAEQSSSKQTIEKLQKQVIKSQAIKKVYLSRYAKTNSDSYESIEEQMPSIKKKINETASFQRPSTLTTFNDRVSMESIAAKQEFLGVNAQFFKFQNKIGMITGKNHLKPSGTTLSSFSNKKEVLKNINGQNSSAKESVNKIISQVSIKTKNDQPVGTSTKTLQQIWQQRDNEISKMDELFQSLNNRLKQYQQ